MAALPIISVTRLEYEAYPEMAIREMRRIGEQAVERFGASAVAIVHRIGVVEIGEASVAIAASATHRDAAFAACIAEFGGVDLAYLNAGIGVGSDFGEFPDEEYVRIRGVNQDHVVYGSRAFVRAVRTRTDGRTGGAIIATSSIAGIDPTPPSPLYTLTKFAVVGLIRALGPLSGARPTPRPGPTKRSRWCARSCCLPRSKQRKLFAALPREKKPAKSALLVLDPKELVWFEERQVAPRSFRLGARDDRAGIAARRLIDAADANELLGVELQSRQHAFARRTLLQRRRQLSDLVEEGGEERAQVARVAVVRERRSVPRHDRGDRHRLDVAQHPRPVHGPGRTHVGQRRADQDVAGEQDALARQPDGRVVR